MTKEQESVWMFLKDVGQNPKKEISEPDFKTKQLGYNLIKEELEELHEAVFRWKEKPTIQFNRSDVVKVADALGDLLFVVYGAACHWGIDLQPVFDEIVRSNNTKIGGGTIRQDGKYVKGEGYKPPLLSPILSNQGYFVKPTLLQAQSYAAMIGFPIEKCKEFIDFYESKNWHIGKSKMKSWEASMRTWQRRDPKLKSQPEQLELNFDNERSYRYDSENIISCEPLFLESELFKEKWKALPSKWKTWTLDRVTPEASLVLNTWENA